MRTRVIKTIIDKICDFIVAYQEAKYEYYKKHGHKF